MTSCVKGFVRKDTSEESVGYYNALQFSIPHFDIYFDTTSKINPNFPFWLWHFVAQFQGNPFRFTKVTRRMLISGNCVALFLNRLKSQPPKSIQTSKTLPELKKSVGVFTPESVATVLLLLGTST